MEHTHHDVVSPELALVSPELAAVARHRLSARPWEIARASAATALAMQPELSEPETEARIERNRVQMSAAEIDSHRRRLMGGIVLVALVVVVAVIGASRLDQRQGTGEEGPSGELAGETPVDDASPLLPSGGYVVSPAGSFLADSSGHAIESFTLPFRCGSRQLVIEDIPVSARSLQFTGKAVGRAVTVRLSGRLLARGHVRGVVTARGPTCNRGPLKFIARLS